MRTYATRLKRLEERIPAMVGIEQYMLFGTPEGEFFGSQVPGEFREYTKAEVVELERLHREGKIFLVGRGGL